MPLVEVKLWDIQATEETVRKIIAGVTAAMVEATGAKAENTWVIVEGVPPARWGVGVAPRG